MFYCILVNCLTALHVPSNTCSLSLNLKTNVRFSPEDLLSVISSKVVFWHVNHWNVSKATKGIDLHPHLLERTLFSRFSCNFFFFLKADPWLQNILTWNLSIFLIMGTSNLKDIVKGFSRWGNPYKKHISIW